MLHDQCNSVSSCLLREVIGDIRIISVALEYFIHNNINLRFIRCGGIITEKVALASFFIRNDCYNVPAIFFHERLLVMLTHVYFLDTEVLKTVFNFLEKH
jgi:hypothetical protein